ncbi:MAG: NAD-dependent epimerase/dehydratase family protein, partial [Flavobacteriales bacterium]
MKILITGATGLVGSAIVELCQKKNIDVNYLSTSKSK